MNEELKFWISFSFLIGFGIVIGWAVNEVYSNYGRNFDGFWIPERNYTEAQAFLKTKEPTGNWVCVNIKNMDYRKAVEICKHEVAHEIFARSCEKDVDKCFEVANESE